MEPTGRANARPMTGSAQSGVPSLVALWAEKRGPGTKFAKTTPCKVEGPSRAHSPALASCRLPGAAAAVTANDAAPVARAAVAGEPAAAAGSGRADRYLDRNHAAAADRAGNPAATGRGNPAADHQKRHAVAGGAIAPRGREYRGPGAIIGSGPSGRAGGTRCSCGGQSGENGQPAQGTAPTGKNSGSGNRLIKMGHFLPVPG